MQSGQESRIHQIPPAGYNSPLIIDPSADHVPCRVEITAEPSLPVHPHTKLQDRKVINRFTAVTT
jgi:hypothetical protein